MAMKKKDAKRPAPPKAAAAGKTDRKAGKAVGKTDRKTSKAVEKAGRKAGRKADKKATRVAKAAKKAARKVAPIPAGYHSITPHLIQTDSAAAIAFYEAAFGAKRKLVMAGPDGKVLHAEIQIGDSMVMMADEMPPMPGYPGVYKAPSSAGSASAGLFLYVKNVDKAFERAVAAGCTVRMPLSDMFWGDRYGAVIDPFGHTWAMATHQKDLTPKQMAKAQQQAMAEMGGAHG